MKVAWRKAANAGDRHEKIPELKGLGLIEALVDLPGETVHVGSESGYFFVGTPKEFVKDEELLDWAYGHRLDPGDHGKDFADRKVWQAYRRFLGGTALIVDGDERGACWTREEYERWRTDASAVRDAGGLCYGGRP